MVDRIAQLCKAAEDTGELLSCVYAAPDYDGFLTALCSRELPIIMKRSRKPEGGFTVRRYYNIAAAFDTESTTYKIGSDYYGTMYIWQLAIDGVIIYGRRWEEFVEALDRVADELETTRTALVIYVHNLPHDFQFFRKHRPIKEVFATDTRKPLHVVEETGIEWLCSLMLSGRKLEALANDITEYTVRKAVGDLDYNKPRHYLTPLTEKELYYCLCDVVVVSAYIAEQIHRNGDNITKIPLTKTGYVRRYCREQTITYKKEPGKGQKGASKNHAEDPEIKRHNRSVGNYRATINSLVLTLPEYLAARGTFGGGFVHANGWRAHTVWLHVGSQDFTSSYPAVMVAEHFPMSAPKAVTAMLQGPGWMDIINRWKGRKNVIMKVGFENLQSSQIQERPISESKLLQGSHGVEAPDNGRVVNAQAAILWVTEIDMEYIGAFYTWDAAHVLQAYAFDSAYLPTPFVRAILELYRDKTTLKGVKGKELEYLLKKELLNSCYGMAVTDIIRPENEYIDDEWTEAVSKAEFYRLHPDKCMDMLTRENERKTRFLYYPWGVYVTSYARRNLLMGGVLPLGNDYIYSDTDSVKYLNPEAHVGIFEAYNRQNEKKMAAAMKYHGFPSDYWTPATIKGIKKPLGAWDFEGIYRKFKTLGAKRYLAQEADGEYKLTVAGVNKEQALKWMLDTYGPDGIFDAFSSGLVIPAAHSGKLIHGYEDRETAFTLVDYTGHAAPVHELSSVALYPADYNLKISGDYEDIDTLLNDITNFEEWDG